MLPEIRSALSAERVRELQSAGCRQRLALEAGHSDRSARKRLGKRLISIGVKLAGDVVLINRLFVG